jgi:hypothetical protein
LNHPDRAIPALERTRDAGFGTILGFVRHMHHTVTHEHVRRAKPLGLPLEPAAVVGGLK